MVELYRVQSDGIADQSGLFVGKLQITYRPAQPVQPLLTVTAKTAQGTLTGTAAVTIQPPAIAASSPLAHIRIAFTQNNNVYLMNMDGTGRTAVTTNGTVATKPNAVNYPWYQWSSDGKYLLLVRENGNKYGNIGVYGHYYDLLLTNAAGILIRTLVREAPASEIYPTWADDADAYAYTSAIAYQAATPTVYTVSVRDLGGHTLALFKTTQFLSQCDTDPIFGARPESPKLIVPYGRGPYDTFQWSKKKQVAAFNISCAAPDVVTGSSVHVKLQIGSYASGSWAPTAAYLGWEWARTVLCQTDARADATNARRVCADSHLRE